MGAQPLVGRPRLSAATKRIVRVATCKVFRPQLDELSRLHRQWPSELDAFKDFRCARRAQKPKVLEYE